jgi:hypothetical protein
MWLVSRWARHLNTVFDFTLFYTQKKNTRASSAILRSLSILYMAYLHIKRRTNEWRSQSAVVISAGVDCKHRCWHSWRLDTQNNMHIPKWIYIGIHHISRYTAKIYQAVKPVKPTLPASRTRVPTLQDCIVVTRSKDLIAKGLGFLTEMKCSD